MKLAILSVSVLGVAAILTAVNVGAQTAPIQYLILRGQNQLVTPAIVVPPPSVKIEVRPSYLPAKSRLENLHDAFGAAIPRLVVTSDRTNWVIVSQEKDLLVIGHQHPVRRMLAPQSYVLVSCEDGSGLVLNSSILPGVVVQKDQVTVSPELPTWLPSDLLKSRTDVVRKEMVYSPNQRHAFRAGPPIGSMGFRTKHSFCRYLTNLNPLIPLKNSIRSHLVVLGLATIITLTGCASGGVERDTAANAAVHGGPKLEKPTALYIGEVATNVSVVKSNHAAEDAKRINDAFKKALLERLPEIAPASEFAGQKSGWLVTAQALNVDFGDTTLRIVFGFGAGQAKLLYLIKVYDLSKSTTEPIHVFKANADSGSGIGGESAPIAQVADSDYVGRNSARCARATRDELMELYKK